MADMSPEDVQARVRALFGDNVTAQPVHQPVIEDSSGEVEDLITKVCYFYPQYNLETAQHLTNSQVNALLMQVEKQRAIDLYNHTLIAVAPHTKKGKLVDSLIKQYKKIIES